MHSPSSQSSPRSPRLSSRHLTSSLKPSYSLNHFPKSLATNDQSLFHYLRPLVSGPYSQQQNYSDYIFHHLKSLIDHEINIVVLKNVYKFIMTMILLGNLHLYQKIVKYLLPSVLVKFDQSLLLLPNHKTHQSQSQTQTKNHNHSISHLTLFFSQAIFVLAQWIPQDFYNPNSPSIFTQIKLKYHLDIKNFHYFTLQKIVFCNRIIKDLGIAQLEQKCEHCDKKPNKNKNHNNCKNFQNLFKQKSQINNTHQNQKKSQKSQKSQKSLTKKNPILNSDTEHQPHSHVQDYFTTKMNPQQQKTQKSEKTKSKRVFSPNDYQCFDTKQLQQKQSNIFSKLKSIRKQVKDVKYGLYQLEQKKLLSDYDQKSKKGSDVIASMTSLRSFKSIQKNQQFTPITKSQSRSSSKKSSNFPSLTLLSPKSKHGETPKQELLPKKQLVFNHIQVFKNFLKKKPSSHENKFKIALISSKGNLHLRKMGNYVLKCRTFCREKLLKLKLFVDEYKSESMMESRKENNFTPSKKSQSKHGIVSEMQQTPSKTSVESMQFEFIEPKKCLESHKSQEEKTELILNYGNGSKVIEVEPILIRVQDETMYLPVGFWHMVRGSSKKLVERYEKLFKKQQQFQGNTIEVCRKEDLLLNREMAKSLNEVSKILKREFEHVNMHGSREQFETQEIRCKEQQEQLKQIQLKGSIIHVQFVIEISYNKRNKPTKNYSEKFINIVGKVQRNEYNGSETATSNSSTEKNYLSHLIQELEFVFCQNTPNKKDE